MTIWAPYYDSHYSKPCCHELRYKEVHVVDVGVYQIITVPFFYFMFFAKWKGYS